MNGVSGHLLNLINNQIFQHKSGEPGKHCVSVCIVGQNVISNVTSICEDVCDFWPHRELQIFLTSTTINTGSFTLNCWLFGAELKWPPVAQATSYVVQLPGCDGCVSDLVTNKMNTVSPSVENLQFPQRPHPLPHNHKSNHWSPGTAWEEDFSVNSAVWKDRGRTQTADLNKSLSERVRTHCGTDSYPPSLPNITFRLEIP